MSVETAIGRARYPTGPAALCPDSAEGRLPTNGSTPSARTLQDSELVRRAQALEEEALYFIFSTYFPKLYNYGFIHLGDAQAAEDLASEVILRVLESIQRYRFNGTPFSAWVFRIARNRLIELYRRRKLRQEIELRESLARVPPNIQTLAERAFNRGQLQVALRCLTEKQRQVIVLRFIEGLDIASVANIVRVSTGAVRSLQHRALRSLQRLMRPYRSLP